MEPDPEVWITRAECYRLTVEAMTAACRAEVTEARAPLLALLREARTGIAFFVEVRGMPDGAFDFRPLLAKIDAALAQPGQAADCGAQHPAHPGTTCRQPIGHKSNHATARRDVVWPNVAGDDR